MGDGGETALGWWGGTADFSAYWGEGGGGGHHSGKP